MKQNHHRKPVRKSSWFSGICFSGLNTDDGGHRECSCNNEIQKYFPHRDKLSSRNGFRHTQLNDAKERHKTAKAHNNLLLFIIQFLESH